jgi:hypothetical protein
MDELIRTFALRGDLAHLALFCGPVERARAPGSRCANSRRRRGASTISCASLRASTRAMETGMDTLHTVLRAIRS